MSGNVVTLNIDTVGELLEKAAAEGIRVGKAGTEGHLTAEGIAGTVILDARIDGIL